MEVALLYTAYHLIKGKSLTEIHNSEEYKKLKEIIDTPREIMGQIFGPLLKILGIVKPGVGAISEIFDAARSAQQSSSGVNIEQIIDDLSPETKEKLGKLILEKLEH